MADIYGAHFDYAGRSSIEFGLIFVNVNTERFTNLSGSISGVTIFNKSIKQRYLVDDDYSESPVSYEVEIITDDQRYLSLQECRRVEKWLFNRHNYRKLYLDSFDDCDGATTEVIDSKEKRLYLRCRFINPSRIEGDGGVVGYRATLEADSGYWWQDALSKTFNIANSGSNYSTINVRVDSDIDDYIYPKVTVTMNSVGGDIILINGTDDVLRVTKFESIPANTTLIIRSDVNYVSGNYYQSFVNRNFPRLLDGNNAILVGGAVKTIKYEFSNRRYL